MPRIIYPDDFAGLQTLFQAITAENTSLGTKSPLLAFAKQQKFDLSKLQPLAGQAAEQDRLSKELRRSSENSTQQRDLLFLPVWKHTTDEVHYLTGFYRGSERELGAWGVPVDGKARIAYPPSFAEQAALVNTFLAKHNSYPAGESPLQIFIDEHSIDVSADLQAVAAATDREADKNKEEADSQAATQQRDNIWEPVVKVIHLIGGFLMGLYASDSRKMTVWGYKVAEDAAGEREQITTIDPSTSKTVTSVAIPSVLLNLGTIALEVARGTGKKKEIFMLGPGEKLGMTKGFSTIVITNPSTLEVGKVQVTVNK